MHRVDRGEISTERLMQQIEAELDILFRNRAETEERRRNFAKRVAAEEARDERDA